MKTIVITGSTDGIGKLAAMQLASAGHQVIIHGRNPEKLTTVKDQIISSTGNQNIIAFNADLSDLNEVRSLAKSIAESVSSIDVLINNAGVFKSNPLTNKDGLDLRFVVNYLAPVVLTGELIPLLTKSSSRIINLSSAAQAPVSMNALNGTETIDSQNSYAQSKLALTMWSFHLANKFPSITTIAVNPGSLLNTKMVQEAYCQFWAPADKGSSILFQLATDEKHLSDSGKYFDNDKGSFSNAHSDAYDQEKIDLLLSETNKIVTNNSLKQARALTLPSREASLQRDVSVAQFWKNNHQLVKNAWAEWELENKDSLLIPDETLLDPRLRKAINDAWENPEKENAVADLWEEIIPNVYSAQFFDVEQLTEFRNYLEEVVNSQIPKRAPYGIQLNRYGIMLDPRSDGYLAAPNFQAFYNDIMNRYMRPIARLLLGTYGYDNQTFGFSIQYNPDKDKDLKPHTDASAATLNININLPDETFTGSQVDFHDNTTGKTIQRTFKPGEAIIHTGNVPHATHPIITGQRSNLVVWLYGDRMQIPRGGTSSYGNFDHSESKIEPTESVSAHQRWSLPDSPKDTSAPF